MFPVAGVVDADAGGGDDLRRGACGGEEVKSVAGEIEGILGAGDVQLLRQSLPGPERSGGGAGGGLKPARGSAARRRTAWGSSGFPVTTLSM